MASLTGRYEHGEHIAVWEELRYQPVSTADSAAMAELTMRRVACNVDAVVDRFGSARWRWAYPEMVRQAPTYADLWAIPEMRTAWGRSHWHCGRA